MSPLSTKRRIGILGGMGPEATVLLMSKVIEFTQAKDDRDHVPMLVDNNTQVPSRIAALIEKTGEDPEPVLISMARKLEAQGVTALAMPCNTAHFYASRIQSAVSIPLLNMINLSVDAALDVLASSQEQSYKVGVLASPAVQSTGLFDSAYKKRGIHTFYPSDQDSMLVAIKAVKSGHHSEAIKLLKNAAIEMQQQDIGIVLVACTELSLIREAIPKEMVAIDTLDVLAKAVVSFASQNTEANLNFT